MTMLSELSAGVLVTGVGAPPGLGTLRSLREADGKLRLFGADLNPYAGGLYEPGVTPLSLPAAHDGTAYVEALLAAREAVGFDMLIPGSEAEVAALAPRREELRDAGLRLAVPAPDVLRYGIDKGVLLELAKSLAIPHPSTCLPDEEADLDDWLGGFPCVIKPRCSRGARGVSYPESGDDLRRKWRETVAVHGPCVVQQYIPGGAETVFTIGTLWNDGELVVSTLHRKLQTNPPSGGVAVAGETVVDADVLEAGLDVLRATGPWHGLAAVEVKRSEPGVPAYLLEINPRMWGFGYLMTMAGLNVPALLCRMLAGDPDLHTYIPSTSPPYARTRMIRTWQDVAIQFGPESEG